MVPNGRLASVDNALDNHPSWWAPIMSNANVICAPSSLIQTSVNEIAGCSMKGEICKVSLETRTLLSGSQNLHKTVHIC
jgi:hypothetical protein